MAKFQKNISLIKSGSIAAPIIKASKHASLDKQKVSTASDKQLAKKKTSIIKKTIKKEFSKDKKAFVKKTKDSSSASENKVIKKVFGEKVPKEKAKKRAISAVKKTLSKKKNF